MERLTVTVISFKGDMYSENLNILLKNCGVKIHCQNFKWAEKYFSF